MAPQICCLLLTVSSSITFGLSRGWDVHTDGAKTLPRVFPPFIAATPCSFGPLDDAICVPLVGASPEVQKTWSDTLSSQTCSFGHRGRGHTNLLLLPGCIFHPQRVQVHVPKVSLHGEHLNIYIYIKFS